MTATVPTQVPSELIAGDTWAWTRSLSDYPAGTWTATAYFELSGSSFNAAASASGTDHAFTIAAATTATQKAGRYKWWVRVTDGTTTTTVEDGWVDVKPNPAASGTRDHRSPARQMLDAIEATLIGRATNDQLAMSLNGRSIQRTPLPELAQWRIQLRNEVRTEERASAAGASRNIKVRYRSV